MKDWSEYTLEQLGEFKNGVNFSSDKMGQGIALVNVKDITDSPLLHPEKMALVDLDLSGKSGESYYAKVGDIFFVRSSVKREGVGAVGMLKNNSIPVIHCGFVIRFRASFKDVFPRFLFYLLSNPFYREKVRGLSGGATIVNISQESLKTLKVLLPPISSQRKIASILSAYDDLIENNLKRIKLLEELAKLTYEEWFVKFRIANRQLNVAGKTELPEGWMSRKLQEVAFLIKDSVLPENVLSNTPYIGLEHIPRKSITLSEWETAEKISSMKYSFSKGDILFGKIRPYFHKVGVALVDGIASSDTIILRAKSRSHQGIILQTVFSELFVNTATQSSNGTKMPRANWDVLKDYPVIIPTQNVLNSYDTLSNSILTSIENFVKQNQILKEARDILLPRLMSGVIDVDGAQEESLAMAAEPIAKYRKA